MLSLGLSDVYSLLAFASPFSDARPKSSLLFHTKEVEASAWNDDGVIHDVEEGETVTFDANLPFPKFRQLVASYVSNIAGTYYYDELRVEASVDGDEEIDRGIRVDDRDD